MRSARPYYLSVAIPCRTCGVEPRDGARFCDACGAPLTAPAERAEFKQVTVLFADVVRSMDIAAALGSERLREVMGDLFNRSSKIVQRYGGTVDKFTGDGIMAVFGAPIALEDHAVRACRAALDIQRDGKKMAIEAERRDGITLQLRVGLNSGEVVVGEIGSGASGLYHRWRASGYGATDGVRSACWWGDGQRVDGASGGESVDSG